ncbi:MAG TPA: Ppx/GppA phosphatase family protein, partial [Vicinamibacteria bacterium]|nr:Ppx/GppA phosphatase family protein [Vicinamibacteria bacterium]
MKIAAIDLGSNSLHLVLVETLRAGAFRVIGREKEMVRLGARTLSRGKLSTSAMQRGLEALRKYKRLSESAGAEKILAVATSAVREAANGEDFLERVGRELGIWPRAVSGDEEARLIYLAALHSIHLEGRRALVIDIGGGSVELAVGGGQGMEYGASEKLGVLRMSEEFVGSDPLGAKDESRLVKHVQKTLAPHRDRLRGSGFECAVGTSGTMLAVGALALQRAGEPVPDPLHHVTVSAEQIHAARKWLCSTDLKARLKAPSLDESRADIIVPGAVVLDTILQELGVRELTLCEWALREGILLDYIHGHRRTLARAEAYPDVRRRSVVSLAERCQWHEKHARKVAELSTALFDATRKRHRLGDSERALLEYAALLHDVGHHISYVGHHKHTYYLIKNGGLRGFTPTEVEVVANVARYHRRGRPRRKHPWFGALPRAERRTVEVLAGHLRLADALDRSHRQIVRGLRVSGRGRVLRVELDVTADPALELWAVPRRGALLEKVLGVSVKVKTAPAAVVALAEGVEGRRSAGGPAPAAAVDPPPLPA